MAHVEWYKQGINLGIAMNLTNVKKMDGNNKALGDLNLARCIRSLTVSVWLVVMGLFSGFALAEDHPAQQTVVSAVNKVLNDLKTFEDQVQDKPELLDQTIETNIVPNLDFSMMTRLSVGKSWRKASQDKKAELVTEFKTFLLNSYSDCLLYTSPSPRDS